MANIDVSDVMADPDLVDPLVILRREAQVNKLGRNELSEVGTSTFGSIQSVSGKTLQRIPEAMRVENLMSFWVKGKIVSDGKGLYSDILLYKGSRFTIKQVFDWTNWGQGWCEGLCVREKMAL